MGDNVKMDLKETGCDWTGLIDSSKGKMADTGE
jgi:hypothetical protein